MRASGGEVKGYQQGGAPQLPFEMGGPPTPPQPAEPPPGQATYGPAIGLQKPFGNYMPMGSYGGGYATPMNLMAMGLAPQPPQPQPQPRAHGGEVDESALAHARMLLHGVERAVGGRVERAEGGKVLELYGKGGPLKRDPRSPKQLFDLLTASGEHISPDKQFSYACAKSPQIRAWFRQALKAGANRALAREAIYHCLSELLDEQS
jgi:hypothetical protein